MRYKLWRTAAALFISIALYLTSAPPALADLDLNPADYFQFTFEPVAFDKSEVAAGETFHITLKGRAACIQDLPLPISEITITSEVIARPGAGGTDLVLNHEYVININPLPKKAGEYYDINQSVALRFPADAAPGDYSVIGKLTEAKVKVLVWMDVTGSFPQEQSMGTVKCTFPATATATATAALTTTPPKTAAPVTAAPAATSTPVPGWPPSPIHSFPHITVTTIVLLIVVVTLIIVVAVLVRRRR